MRNAILLLVVALVACSGRAGSGLLGDGGAVSGLTRGRTGTVDASMLPDVLRLDAQRVPDVLAVPDALVTPPDVRTVVPDVLPVVDVLAVPDVGPEVRRDSLAADSVQVDHHPWGYRDDAGLFHCGSNLAGSAGPGTTAPCGYVLQTEALSAKCTKFLLGVPASCRWGAPGAVAWEWFVNECAECAGLEAWTAVPRGTP